MKTEQLLLKNDDGMEIVIVSDTVRQRRSRTPISAISNDGNRESNVMPDLLPNTLQLSQVSSFSDLSAGEMQSREVDAGGCSVVEIKERNLSSKIVIRSISFDDAKVDTINIFESCSRFEPEQVETVHIIDVSDTDTASSTPQLNRKSLKSLNSTCGSADELETELKRELETVSNFETVDQTAADLSIKKLPISFNEHKVMKGKNRDVLFESEISDEKAIRAIKLRPTLKELWMEERNSFYDNDDNDEPLEFSDDEEIPRYSMEMDSDSDVVVALHNL